MSQVVVTEWSLNLHMVESIWALWDRPHIELLVTRVNHKLSTFMSPFLDRMAWAMGTMALSWKGMWMYAFPLVSKVLAKIRVELV